MKHWIKSFLYFSMFFYLGAITGLASAHQLDAQSKRVFDEVKAFAKKKNSKSFCRINFHEGLRDFFLTSTVENVSNIEIANHNPKRPSERTYHFQITLPRDKEEPKMIWVSATYFKGKCEDVVVGRIEVESVFWFDK